MSQIAVIVMILNVLPLAIWAGINLGDLLKCMLLIFAKFDAVANP